METINQKQASLPLPVAGMMSDVLAVYSYLVDATRESKEAQEWIQQLEALVEEGAKLISRIEDAEAERRSKF